MRGLRLPLIIGRMSRRRDEKRERFLHDRGHQVARFGNDDVYRNIEGVLDYDPGGAGAAADAVASRVAPLPVLTGRGSWRG